MFLSERIQNTINRLESGAGSRIMWTTVCLLTIVGMMIWYDLWAYHSFSAPEAMDSAQVARNLAQGHGYTTEIIQPFSLYLLEKKQHFGTLGQLNPATYNGYYPDFANPPVYPVLLAGWLKVHPPKWEIDTHTHFWSQDGIFLRYQPEFFIAIFNQLWLLAAIVLTFFIARKLFDNQVAWLSALLMFGSDLLWKFSVSGLSTSLLMVIFLGLIWSLIKFEEQASAETPNTRKLLFLAITAGLIVGFGLLTRYAFGWLILPVAVFIGLFGGARRTGLAVTACLAFLALIAPWIARNFIVSGTLFGTAGYAAIEGTRIFPDTKLLQSPNPDLIGFWVMPLFHKLANNSSSLFQNNIPHIGGWVGILFFAGLLLGFRNITARRLRYFIMMCLAVLTLAQALGRTELSTLNLELNSENLLVLLTPMIFIFGTAFFMTLLDQMILPAPEVRYAPMLLLVLIGWMPLMATMLPPKPPTISYPPYHPPDIQRLSSWTDSNELMMSDMPWAVAWYGQRPCMWISYDAREDFFAINDNFQTVKSIYLTTTLDGNFLSDMARGDANSWGHLALQMGMKNQFPQGFPLRTAHIMASGLFLTDRKRWPDAPTN